MLSYPKKYQPSFYPLSAKQIVFHDNLINKGKYIEHNGKQIKINFVDKENFMVTIRNPKNSIKLLVKYTDNFEGFSYLISEVLHVIKLTEKLDDK
jgi:hypothetical protein